MNGQSKLHPRMSPSGRFIPSIAYNSMTEAQSKADEQNYCNTPDQVLRGKQI